ncbi:MAG: DUF2339 domain-containing protein [Candidatus Eisenbacteria bacterium]
METLLILVAVLALLSGPVALVLSILSFLRTRRMERHLRSISAERGEAAPWHAGDDRAARPAATTTAATGTATSVPPPLSTATTRRDPTQPGPAAPEPTGAARGPSGPFPPATTRTQAPTRDLESRIGGEWLTWIGVLAIFFGTAFFLAVKLGEHPLAGQGQVWVGLGVAVAFLGTGRFVAGRSGLFLGQGLLGGGTALVFLSIFAASAFHHIIGSTTAYLLLAGAALLGSVLALAEGSRTVAGLTLTGALFTPILLEPTSAHPLFFPYLAFVNLDAILVRIRKNWPGLVLGAFVGTTFLVLFWWDEFFGPNTQVQALAGVGVLWLLYVALPFVTRTAHPVWRLASSVLVLANGGAGALFLWGWLDDLSYLRGIAIALLGLIYVVLGRLAPKTPDFDADEHGRADLRDSANAALTPGRSNAIHIVYELTGLALGAIALPIHFDLETVTVGWALLAFVLVHLGVSRGAVGHRLLGYLVLAFALFHHGLFDLETSGLFHRHHGGDLGAQWVAGLVTAIAILAIAWRLQRARRDGAELLPWEERSGTPLVLLSSAFVLYLLSIQVWRGLVGSGERRALLGLSLTWALYGGVLIGIGFLRRYRPLWLAGVGLLLALVAKVFTLDISVLDRGERITSFIGVGVLLLVISLLYQRGRRRPSGGKEDV